MDATLLSPIIQFSGINYRPSPVAKGLGVKAYCAGGCSPGKDSKAFSIEVGKLLTPFNGLRWMWRSTERLRTGLHLNLSAKRWALRNADTVNRPRT
jgi:hypothetical protein